MFDVDRGKMLGEIAEWLKEEEAPDPEDGWFTASDMAILLGVDSEKARNIIEKKGDAIETKKLSNGRVYYRRITE